jgi:membrane-bound lytic murein transglycosylase B
MMLFAGAVVYAAVSGCASTPAGAVTIAQRELQPFIGRMVKEHGFSRAKLERLFGRVRMRPGVLAAIRRPAEAKPWFQYRPIFLTSARIRGGVRFWDRYAPILKRARQRYGVPPQIVTGIIGVETRYGRRMGSIPVLDSLSTLAFDYPPRARFFRRELAQFLLLARDNDLDPLRVKGSYAGAMGMPQFIASSYRRYAVDFDGDGHVDLANSPADAIGSVARYLSAHGWKPGAPVAVPAKVSGDHYRTLLGDNDRRLSDPQRTVTELEAFGVEARGDAADTPGDRPAKLLRLQGRDGPGYWITFHNFYVITRYNHSALYAMAVYQLGRAIRAAREQEGE